MTISHNTITDPDIHEPKGASGAAAGDVYTADGSGSGVWSQPTLPSGSLAQGWYNYNDEKTSTTPIALTNINTDYPLTNDGVATGTILTYGFDELPNIWNTTTNRFAFNNGTTLNLGDTIEIRVDLEFTTTALNTAISLDLILGEGVLDDRLSVFTAENYKKEGTYKVARTIAIFIGSTENLTNPALLVAKATEPGASVVVNGFYIKAQHTIL